MLGYGHDGVRLRRSIVLKLLLVCLSYAKTADFTDFGPSASSTSLSWRDSKDIWNAPTENVSHYSSKPLVASSDPSVSNNVEEMAANCNRPAIEDFPQDFFTQSQRAKGGVLIHILIAVYLVLALSIICDEYFVPALEMLCQKLRLKPDVAGATFMAAGTSSPEFFTNVMGTFVTESDLGIGTIVGSAVFNIFGVIAVCGLFSGRKVKLDWYPITRDCVIYGITVLILFAVLHDEKVYWYESLIMVTCYFGYILIMFFNSGTEKWAHQSLEWVQRKVSPHLVNESTPLHTADKSTQIPTISTDSIYDAVDNGEDGWAYPWKTPEGKGIFAYIWWLLFLPINVLFFFTIPNVQMGPKCAKFYPLSFIICICWIGAIAYVVTWMITVIGYTLAIPDSVMGLTFLAVGTSIPEVVSSLIVSRQGLGSMAVSNSIGSNTFDILLCLGLPWLVKSLLSGSTGEKEWLVQVRSEGLAYTVVSLFISLLLLYLIFLACRFILSHTLGIVATVIYAAFLTLSILFELNIFFVVNLPTCLSDK